MRFRIYRLIISWFIIFVFTSPSVFAMPSRRALTEFAQPNGKKFKAVLWGDERLNWLESEGGDIIKKGRDGYWYYAQIKDGNLTESSNRYGIDLKPSSAISRQYLATWIRRKQQSSNEFKNNFAGLSDNYESVTSINGPQKLLVLLIEFTNFSVRYSETEWNNKFFGSDGSTVNNYYKEVSGGRFYFTPAGENYGTGNDGIIKVRLNYNHPDTGYDIDERNSTIVSNALKAADTYIDYSKYDINRDGYISRNELHIVTIVSGYEESYGTSNSPSVWGHSWSIPYGGITCDGVKLCADPYGGYTQQGEIQGDHMATIGILCHELAHDLGLPDLYDTDGSSSGVGVHSLMAEGSWMRSSETEEWGSSPTHLDAWSKIYVGFSDPLTVTAKGSYMVNSIDTKNYNILKVPTKNSGEYFLVENREFVGFDRGLKEDCTSGGIAIWHIDDNIINRYINNEYTGINDNELHKGVAIEEANISKLGYSQLDRNSSGPYNHYYYSGNNTVFSPASVPNSSLYGGVPSNISITVPVQSSSTMSINIINPGVKYGDVNGDNSVTLNDCSIIKDYILGRLKSIEYTNWKAAGDVDGDGRITSGDYVYIKRYLSGKISVFPVESAK